MDFFEREAGAPGAFRLRADRLAALLERKAPGAAVGFLSNPAFLAAIDTHLEKAPCLLCYGTASPSKAAAVEREIHTMLKFFDPGSYRRSVAHKRNGLDATNDLTMAEISSVAAFNPVTVIRNSHGAMMLAGGCEHFPGVVAWLYSTHAARRSVRRLVKGGRRLSLALATEAEYFALRVKKRAYAVRSDAMSFSELLAELGGL